MSVLRSTLTMLVVSHESLFIKNIIRLFPFHPQQLDFLLHQPSASTEKRSGSSKCSPVNGRTLRMLMRKSHDTTKEGFPAEDGVEQTALDLLRNLTVTTNKGSNGLWRTLHVHGQRRSAVILFVLLFRSADITGRNESGKGSGVMRRD